MRKLATVRKITNVLKHENADTLSIYIIDGWQVIDRIDAYKNGDLVIYLEIDSFLPLKPEFEFLRKSSFKKMGILEGFRLKTIRLRGELSQGLLLPLSYLGEVAVEEGMEVTDLLGVIKYDPPLPASISGDIAGVFPTLIPKTDEERIQNLDYAALIDYTYIITEKLDGTSTTFFYLDGRFGVCSRNYEMKEDDKNTMWMIANRLHLPQKLKEMGMDIAIQGETIGLGIQKNKYKINNTETRVFKIYDIKKGNYLNANDMIRLCDKLGLSTVPVLNYNFALPPTINELLAFADERSALYDTDREGLVFYCNEQSNIHFKVISNKYLEKNDD